MNEYGVGGSMKVWLVGVGPMGQAYATVLNALEQPFLAIGRGEEEARRFAQAFGVMPVTGGLSAHLDQTDELPDAVIVAVGVEALAEVTRELIVHGVRRILVEKPGGMTRALIEGVALSAEQRSAEVSVAYNRRFYASTRAAQKLIADDGGVQSFHFEFTEWAHRIGPLQKAPGVKENWLLANSTHVIDLAFYLGGWPASLSTHVAGGLDWHPSGSIFAGSGISDGGALFSYQANWASPGRWGVEILTRAHRLILCPLEELRLQKIGSVTSEPVELDDALDHQFKAGLYRQTQGFLEGALDGFCSIAAMLKHAEVYERIAGIQAASAERS